MCSFDRGLPPGLRCCHASCTYQEKDAEPFATFHLSRMNSLWHCSWWGLVSIEKFSGNATPAATSQPGVFDTVETCWNQQSSSTSNKLNTEAKRNWTHRQLLTPSWKHGRPSQRHWSWHWRWPHWEIRQISSFQRVVAPAATGHSSRKHWWLHYSWTLLRYVWRYVTSGVKVSKQQWLQHIATCIYLHWVHPAHLFISFPAWTQWINERTFLVFICRINFTPSESNSSVPGTFLKTRNLFGRIRTVSMVTSKAKARAHCPPCSLALMAAL